LLAPPPSGSRRRILALGPRRVDVSDPGRDANASTNRKRFPSGSSSRNCRPY